MLLVVYAVVCGGVVVCFCLLLSLLDFVFGNLCVIVVVCCWLACVVVVCC